MGPEAALAAVAGAAELRLCPLEALHIPAARALHSAQLVRWERGGGGGDRDAAAEFRLVLSACKYTSSFYHCV